MKGEISWLYKKFCQWRTWVNYCEADELGCLFMDTQGYFKHIEIAKKWWEGGESEKGE